MKYTQEQTNWMVERYNSNTTVAEIAQTLDVPVRSVISKLSSLGVYKKKSYLTKTGEVPVKKNQLITTLSDLLGVEESSLDSLEKCNKSVLVLIIKALKESKP